MKQLSTAALLVCMLAIAACGGRKATTDDDSGTVVEPPTTSETTPIRPTPSQPELTAEQRRQMELQKLLATRTLYFDYDEFEIKPDYMDVLAAHASNLADDRSQRIVIEGHCDERGSREYNIGLGERRAQAVRRVLMLQGVSASQIQTISYGEERPAAPGHNEQAWARNRRAEIVYR
ncbi:MAG: peptidoglycan-associated lipoprotein Pal [Gammaproteobacteria bacterium]|nr:peptidoglycan-associated lipoprotein Pal [Gammaproteobacteria bacterium]